MVLQYFVTVSDTGNKIPVEIDKSAAMTSQRQKSNWQTYWKVIFIGDLVWKNTTQQIESGEIVAWVLTVKQNPLCSHLSSIGSHP